MHKTGERQGQVVTLFTPVNMSLLKCQKEKIIVCTLFWEIKTFSAWECGIATTLVFYSTLNFYFLFNSVSLEIAHMGYLQCQTSYIQS